jgi:beta-barrel assembly-enhancing protease
MKVPMTFQFIKRYINNFSVTAGAALLFLSGCATVDVPNVGQAGYKVEDDEHRLFIRAEEMSEVIDESDAIYADPQLEAYLNALAQKLASKVEVDDDIKFSVKIMNEAVLNAFALPNGRIYVNVGILAACEDEAQLAALLGHEMTHVINRHSLRQFRSVINKSAFFSTIEMPAAVFGGIGGSLLTQLAMVSSIYGYSQENEYEADKLGFAMMQKCGYDVREAPKLFENLATFIKDEEVKQPFFFSTHPGVQARIKNFKQLIAENSANIPADAVRDTPEFERFRPELAKRDADLCLAAGYFKTLERSINNYIKNFPDEKAGYFYLGELYRQRQDHDKKQKQRDKKGDYPVALANYDKALKLDPRFGPALKQKGRVLQKMGNAAEAKKVLQEYLDLGTPDDERGYIEDFVKNGG